jgi:glutamate carboxypeptidase
MVFRGYLTRPTRNPRLATPERKTPRRIQFAPGDLRIAAISRLTHDWITAAADEIGARAERELEALVAVSSPSGDVAGAEEAIAVTVALLPSEAEVERPPCSSEGFAPDLIARVRGTGERRLLLVGHVDTVVAHGEHRPLHRDGERLVGSGTIDMKAGVVLALGVMRALVARREAFDEVALLAVTDEEWRTGGLAHGTRFADFDCCLCFEGGELADGDIDGVVVRRKAAATLEVRARGVAAHSGAAPERGRNALLALGEAARIVAAGSDPAGSQRLTAVPTVIRSGEAFNVVPAAGELICDLRADSLDAFDAVLRAVPAEIAGVHLESALVRAWPSMDTREIAAPLLATATELLGRQIVGAERGGASDASHLASDVALTVDGLGPIGGAAHNPDEHVLADSLRPRAEVALAVAAAALA